MTPEELREASDRIAEGIRNANEAFELGAAFVADELDDAEENGMDGIYAYACGMAEAAVHRVLRDAEEDGGMAEAISALHAMISERVMVVMGEVGDEEA